ncbi:MAG: hypothetical protein JOZ83_12065, partial [Silvibacterium sp.]|nr:hypothetical protein [Silvibacterium sp.]
MHNFEAMNELNELTVILVSPNVSEQMGGEAIKALQIYLELERQGVEVYQITHERVQAELSRNYPDMRASYVKDTQLQVLLNRIAPLKALLHPIFLRGALKQLKPLLKEHPGAIVHFNSPVSPVLPFFVVRGAKVVIGPLNGNIHYPPAFRHREGLSYRVRRWLHPLMQFLLRYTFRGKQRADALLVAGGERTYESLRMAGCRDEQFVDSIDSGVLDRLYKAPRMAQSGRNLRFYQNGR